MGMVTKPSRLYSRSMLVVALVFVAVTVVAATVFVLLAPRVGEIASGPDSSDGSEPTHGPDFAVEVKAPLVAEDPAHRGVSYRVDADWVKRVSAASGIPARALAAYAGAAIAKAEAMPVCGLSWTTLAAIGSVESDHGRHGGSTVGEDGTVTPPIYGIALDGEAASHIPDSDGGEFDGDAEFDRAVGPMQLIPQTWRNWHVDGNRDGIEDPQNIDDAVVATSNYLCRASGDMTDRDGWRAGVLAFNGSGAYAQSVADAANRYAAATAGR